MTAGSNFKTCENCGKVWSSREDFLSSPDLELAGYQTHFKDLETGLLVFNHSCSTTLVLKASDFSDLYQGEIFVERATGGDSCPEYCLHSQNLMPCPVKCECAYVREVLQIIKSWPKASTGS